MEAAAVYEVDGEQIKNVWFLVQSKSFKHR